MKLNNVLPPRPLLLVRSQLFLTGILCNWWENVNYLYSNSTGGWVGRGVVIWQEAQKSALRWREFPVGSSAVACHGGLGIPLETKRETDLYPTNGMQMKA